MLLVNCYVLIEFCCKGTSKIFFLLRVVRNNASYVVFGEPVLFSHGGVRSHGGHALS